VDIARALVGERKIETVVTGIRPGEKIHEILISEEECHRALDRGNFYAIAPILPEIRCEKKLAPALSGEYSSGNDVMNFDQVVELLIRQKLMVGQVTLENQELLR
jgi:UDP-glucose 4-epimerase